MLATLTVLENVDPAAVPVAICCLRQVLLRGKKAWEKALRLDRKHSKLKKIIVHGAEEGTLRPLIFASL